MFTEDSLFLFSWFAYLKGMLRRNIEYFLKSRIYKKKLIFWNELTENIFVFYFLQSVFLKIWTPFGLINLWRNSERMFGELLEIYVTIVSQVSLNFDLVKDRSSHRRCSVKKRVLNNFAYFTAKHPCWSLFLTKLQAFRPATLLKRDSNTGVFLWNLRNF